MQLAGLNRNELQQAKRSSYLWGIGFFLFDVAAYSLGLYWAVFAQNYALNIFGSIVAGFATSGLVIVAHDACHQSLTSHRVLNRIIGTIGFLPALHAYSLWRHGHNFMHHLYTNVRGKDYVWEPLSPSEFAKLSGWQQWKYRFFRSLPGHYFYYLCEVWWKRRFVPRKKYLDRIERVYWLDSALVILWLLTLSAVLLLLRCSWDWQVYSRSPGVAVGVIIHGVILPFVIGSMLMSNSEYLHHTHPAIKWYRERPGDWRKHQATVSIHVRYLQPVDWFLHWIMDHTAHHLQPSIPLYQLRSSQELIDQRVEQVLSYHFSFGKMLDITRRCKLYDDQEDCWKDFDGRRTSDDQLQRQSDSPPVELP